MGYAIGLGECFRCRRMFGFNPRKVPTLRVDGEQWPVCGPCIEATNPLRVKLGNAPVIPEPDAYEPIDENEL